ncbi:hypothetical protein FBU59_003357 [Linderina macrospora]|uniref:Uncharacterized protein n=1 Tax=Linderina macrospora TaxID=4868 RepID=A0ACC1J8I9_9FUNG|nr:hypothetical protein FBU59_003357 [Linderina macrospora]
MNPLDTADLKRVSSPTSHLSPDECTQIFQQNPALLEVREFVVRYAPPPLADQKPSKRATSLPTVSLQEIISSLIEENRVDEGVRFLHSVSPRSILDNAKLVNSLLALFKPTGMLEDDLKQRGSFLLQAMAKTSADTSKVWKMDDDRCQSIIQMQHLILTYLMPVRHLFIGKWFNEQFSKYPSEFLGLLDEISAGPETGDDDDSDSDVTDRIADELELTMSQNRLAVACILLEQVAMDLAQNICFVWDSMFMKIASEGSMSLDRVSHPACLLDAVGSRFDAVLSDPTNLLGQKITSLLLDLVAISTSCGAISRFECIQRIAKMLAEKDTDQQSLLIDLIKSDVFAVEVIDHLLTSWFRVDKKADTGGKNVTQMPPSIKKTAFYLCHARPKGSRAGVAKWYDLVCVLSKLVQRSIQAFASRVCQPNAVEPTDSASDIDRPPSMLVVGKQGTGVLGDAVKELRRVVEKKFPLDDAESMDESDSDGNCSNAQLACRMHCELDLMESCLNGE